MLLKPMLFNKVRTVFRKLAILGGSCAKRYESTCWSLFSSLNSVPRVCVKKKRKGDICAILPWEQKKMNVLGFLKGVRCIWTACAARHVWVEPWLSPQEWWTVPQGRRHKSCDSDWASHQQGKEAAHWIMVWHCMTMCDLGKAQPK